MKLEVVNQSEQRIPREFLYWYFPRLVKKLPEKDKKKIKKFKYVLLVFLDEKEAKDLNLRFRKKNYATDVLSFTGADEEIFGELVFCPKVLKRQANEHKLSFRFELAYMVTHGFLHLLGYEHEDNERAAKKMFALQDLIFDDLCHKWQCRSK